ncbi:MAG: hypothetical protein KAK02_00890 [Desulfobulbaceae bacterium]|nr:hypothetical protein [Desulfobulbaceae bacterium]
MICRMCSASKKFRKVAPCLVLVLCFVFLPTASGGVDATSNLSPYIERYANGWIDWGEGLIYGTGRGYLNDNRGIRPMAIGAARIQASGNIVKLAAGLRLDDRNTMKSLGRGRFVVKLKAYLKTKEHKRVYVDGNGNPYYEVTNVAPLHGINGLTGQLMNDLKFMPVRDLQLPPPRPGRDSGLDDEDEPWLILDARKLSKLAKLKPALFPKIVSRTGETIYQLQDVDDQALKERGMARYVTSDAPADRLGNYTDTVKNFFARFSSFLPISEAYAQQTERKRRKRRQYIVKEVSDVRGLSNTNLVISENDARDLKGENASSRILSKCRVVVVASTSIGGVEGSLHRYLAMLD